MSNQFNLLDLAYERVPAFHGLHGILNSDILLEKYNKEVSEKVNSFGRPLTPGEIGCAISHHLCYKKIVDEDIDLAVIFEDDVWINPCFKKALNEAMEAQSSWDLIQFSYPFYSSLNYVFHIFAMKISYEYSRIKLNPRTKNLIRLLTTPFFNLFLNLRTFFLSNFSYGISKNFIRNHPGAGCYMINNKTARLLLKLTEEISYSADNLIVKKLNNIKSMSYYPLLVRQDLGLFESSSIRVSKEFHEI